MRIENLRLQSEDDRCRAKADVKWEDCGQPENTVFIETSPEFAEEMAARPEAFLVGCLIPALHYGEERIAIEGQIDPGLLEGLDTVMELMRIWSGGCSRPLAIEPAGRLQKALYPPRLRAGMVYSGGIDSLATLRKNLCSYPASHPGRIRDALFIHGFDIGGVVSRGMKYDVFDRAFAAMQRVTDAAGITAIPAYTNIRHLCDERELWLNRFFGAVLAAIAHSLSERIDLLYIASSYDLQNLGPCGSHPLLDPEYSSSDLRIRHSDVHLTRLDKLKIISEWGPGFQNLRVCLANVPDRLNCGKCEKCVRTMTGLVAIGALHKTRAFVEDDVSPELFEGFKITIRHREPFYRELLAPLRRRGRRELVETIEKKLEEAP